MDDCKYRRVGGGVVDPRGMYTIGPHSHHQQTSSSAIEQSDHLLLQLRLQEIAASSGETQWQDLCGL
jgi:hypothetical protein